MKKLLVALFALGTLTANAQTFKDTFDSNSMGWTEISGKDGEAVIKEGVMHLEGKKSGGLSLLGGVKDASEIMTHCFTNIDVQKNFEIKCKANVKKSMRTTWSASFWTIWMIEISCCLQLMISKHIFSNIEMAIWLARQKLTESHEKERYSI